MVFVFFTSTAQILTKSMCTYRVHVKQVRIDANAINIYKTLYDDNELYIFQTIM